MKAKLNKKNETIIICLSKRATFINIKYTNSHQTEYHNIPYDNSIS